MIKRKKLLIGAVISCVLVSIVLVNIASSINARAQLRNLISQKMKKDFGSEVIIPESKSAPKKIKLRFAAISDVHNNLDGLAKSVSEINQSEVQFTIGTGDYTNTGTTEELKGIKKELEKLKNPYYLLPGDHDLWNGRDKTDDPLTYYKEQFTLPNNFETQDISLIFINNADIYEGIADADETVALKALSEAPTSIILVVSHKALYHPLTIHRMGYINGKEVPTLQEQSKRIVNKVTERNDKKIYLMHGDLHSSSTFSGPTDSITNFTNGALTKQKNFQTPRYEIYEVYEDNTIERQDKII